jgi:hypothetical protein
MEATVNDRCQWDRWSPRRPRDFVRQGLGFKT